MSPDLQISSKVTRSFKIELVPDYNGLRYIPIPPLGTFVLINLIIFKEGVNEVVLSTTRWTANPHSFFLISLGGVKLGGLVDGLRLFYIANLKAQTGCFI